MAVIHQEQDKIRSLEENARRYGPTTQQKDMFINTEDDQAHANLEQLRDLDIDGMTPRQAVTTLYRLKELALKGKDG